MCNIFNDHNELLEMMIKENPRGYMQKQLNHSAIRVNVVPDTDNIVEVTFCKEIDVEKIENLDLKHFDGYEFDSALTHSQVPIKIRGFGDKIWYFKDNIISSKISSRWNNKTTMGVLDVKEYNLKFLDDKVIFHEHILFDTKTNIEEDLINEMREKSDVALTLHANEQNSMIPHEILDDVESFFEKYYLKFWRIYVTIGVTLFYIFIIRTFWMVLSPKLLIDRKNNNKNTSNYEGLELQQLNHHTSHRSLVVD
uniref:GOLD domain-containing protein n=1 Tax=Heterorhabditis bacteriophora TaxID=37862 RepID=A0A1I7WG71_HETBA